jgi:hypothetical protein
MNDNIISDHIKQLPLNELLNVFTAAWRNAATSSCPPKSLMTTWMLNVSVPLRYRTLNSEIESLKDRKPLSAGNEHNIS